MTLIELTVVLLILTALAGLAIPYVAGTGAYAQCTATEASMVTIRNAIVGSYEQPGYFEDMGGLPGNLDELIMQGGQADFNPVTRRGWRGPYVNSDMKDAFHLNDILLQIPTVDADGDDCSDLGFSNNNQCARLVSLGPDGTPNLQAADADASARGDDRLLYLFIPDPNETLSQACNETL